MSLFKIDSIISESKDVNNIINTPLGVIKLDFHIDEDVEKNNRTNFSITEHALLTRWENEVYEIEMLINKSLPHSLTVEECIGVVWRFKLKKHVKKLIFQTLFDKHSNRVYDNQHHGEDLYALKWHNDEYQLHIGTQDTDNLNDRKHEGDYFPINNDYIFNPFYEDANGLSIILENVEVGKIGQVHVVIAWSKLNETDNLATWLAVDMFTKEILPEVVEY